MLYHKVKSLDLLNMMITEIGSISKLRSKALMGLIFIVSKYLASRVRNIKEARLLS